MRHRIHSISQQAFNTRLLAVPEVYVVPGSQPRSWKRLARGAAAALAVLALACVLFTPPGSYHKSTSGPASNLDVLPINNAADAAAAAAAPGAVAPPPPPATPEPAPEAPEAPEAEPEPEPEAPEAPEAEPEEPAPEKPETEEPEAEEPEAEAPEAGAEAPATGECLKSP
eukprot:TRINITY_DN14768_c0_g1_i1.p1 TRINITY_DN14768_c0_g1~~TRINITY_DN14768_c0_g1_i1.p1  ORF type:complete len:170 (+),score=32.47 TRINITY_DN14768_c0_g1_i1:139-648(+)